MYNEIQNWGGVIMKASEEFLTKIGVFLPTLLGALLVFIIGLMIASGISKLVKMVLASKYVAKTIDSDHVKAGLKKAGIQWTVSEMLAKIIYWIVVLIFLMSVANILGLTVLADTLQRLLMYVPHIFAAVIVIALAIAASRIVRDLVTAGLTTLNVSFTKTIASVAEVIVIIFGVVMAVDQLGFDTTIITANITLIVAGVVVALALAFGLGTKDVVRSITTKHYAEKTFTVGKTVTIGEHTGKVKTISNLGVTLEVNKADVFVAHKELV